MSCLKYFNSKILCTLNSAGHEMIIDAHLIFDYLIIDESAQSVEPLILVPLLNQIKKIILVGDQMQLPPTTFYPNSKNDLFTIKWKNKSNLKKINFSSILFYLIERV